MTSISTGSPLQLLQSQLASSVSSGKVRSGDQDALSSALSDIDSSIQASGADGSAPSKATIESLISKQVQSGKLTSDQASELQEVFASFAAGGGASAGSDTGSSSSSVTNPTTSSSDGGSSDSSSTDLASTISEFMKLLKDSAVTGYGANGTTSGSVTALLVNIKT